MFNSKLNKFISLTLSASKRFFEFFSNSEILLFWSKIEKTFKRPYLKFRFYEKNV